ncbi:hypothetical protein C8J57DRAFT_1255810 [Mycena rebaudengoi]|nr:hypothetical protein C8J57DRAFT_1255810 [Mycena rebaudengoi]
MGEGKFTKVQSDYIESFLPAFVQEMDKGLQGIEPTRWKQQHVSTILESEGFKVLDIKQFPRKTWFEMIVRKFTNYRNQVYLKSSEVKSSLGPLAAKKANPLLKFSLTSTGRQLFAQENYDAIIASSKQRAEDTGNRSPAAVYQNVLKEQWDSLNGDDTHNGLYFGGTREELQLNYGTPWSKFAEDVIPRPLILNTSIPRNSSNHPVFPAVDLEKVVIADLRVLVSDYFDECWGKYCVASAVALSNIGNFQLTVV